MERAILVKADIRGEDDWRAEDSLSELRELARTAGVYVVDEVTCRRDRPTANLYIGKGKIFGLKELALSRRADALIFDNDLSSTQQRNVEDIVDIKTIDRTQLILDIFAQHARSNEGKVQVELAQLEYLAPRLTGKGVLLSRLGGGIGTRGPGEQKLEVDRRRVRERISRLKKELEEIAARREGLRKKREEHSISSVALIGYTNAGKSTLLNSLTGAGVLVEDKLFSTLDSVSRRFILPNKQKAVFSDTVGFLHRLPHHLIEAFKATLEEVVEADVLVHVLDVSHPKADEQADAVYAVLKSLNAYDKHIITALNKIDLIEEDTLKPFLRRFEGSAPISALKSFGLKGLIEKIELSLSNKIEHVKLRIPLNNMKLAHRIFEEAKVLKKAYTEKWIYIEALVPLKIKNVAENEKVLMV